LLTPLSSIHAAETPARKPNIVMIFADDWGWGDLFLFSSDNGPESTGDKPGTKGESDTGVAGYNNYYSIGDTGGMRGRKRSLFEGGTRVPFLVRWPAHTPAGVKNDTTVFTAVDLLPTLCAAAGLTLPDTCHGDGENLLAAFKGETIKRTRPIFWDWRRGSGLKTGDFWPTLAVREGDWKLVMNDGNLVELYNPGTDRTESKNLAKEHPEVVARLAAMAKDWKATLPEKPDPSCIAPNRRR
jgi:arylsulfatase A-like enzyme